LSRKGGFESGIDYKIVEAFCLRYKELELEPFDTFELLTYIFNRVSSE